MKRKERRPEIFIISVLVVSCMLKASIACASAPSSQVLKPQSDGPKNLVADFDRHASRMLSEGLWGMPGQIKERDGRGYGITLSGNKEISFPPDLKTGPVTFTTGPLRASFRLKTDDSFSARHENNRLYYMNEKGEEVFCYYYNLTDQKVRELILVTELAKGIEPLVYTWHFDGALLQYGPQGTVLVYEKNRKSEESRSRFETLDKGMQARIERTLEKELGKEMSFSTKGKLLYAIPAPFYVDGRKAIHRDNIAYTIDDPSTLSLRLAGLDSKALPLLIDPTIDAAEADIKLVGADANDYFGYSVSRAGDFNGDGKDDVIVGAYGDDNGGSGSGVAFIFFGGSTGTIDASNADVTLVGEDFGDQFGYSVACAGDFNADTIDDVIVGAPEDDDGGPGSGCAFIFFGGVTGTVDASNADVKLVGEDAYEKFGSSVSGGGDFGGSGNDDVVVGAYSADNTGGDKDAGRAYIFYGGATGTVDASASPLILEGSDPGDLLGWSVSNAGDFDGGTIDDVIVGAPEDDDGGFYSGCAFIFYGGRVGVNDASTANVILVGADAYDYFGYSVSGAGDFDGAGSDDVIVGAPWDDDGGNGAGCAFIFYGGAAPTVDAANADVTLVGEDPHDHLGYAVSWAGDFNGDGMDDVIVGAEGDDDGGNASGSAFVFYGGSTGTVDASAADIKLVGADTEDFFGSSVSGAGDFDGDGKDDLIVGAYGDDDGGNLSGCAFMTVPSGLAVDYGALGLWEYDISGWRQLGALDPEWLFVYDGVMLIDYGVTHGLWQYDGSTWAQLGGADPDNTGNTMVAYDTGVAIDYGTLGLYYYDGAAWTQLATVDPEWLCPYNGKLLADFGSLYGLWEYDGAAWTQLGAADPDNVTGNTMVAYGTGVAIDYATLGLFYYDGSSWSQLHTRETKWLHAYNGKLLADFGGIGLWEYDGAAWTHLGNADPDNTGNTMVAYDSGVAIDYGALGLFHYSGSAWTRLGGADPEWLGTYKDYLVVDYGTLGLWQYDGAAWTRLGGADADNTGNTMVDADLGG